LKEQEFKQRKEQNFNYELVKDHPVEKKELHFSRQIMFNYGVNMK